MTMVQIGILGMITAILAMQFQSYQKEYLVILGLAVSTLIFLSMLTELEIIVEAIRMIEDAISIDVAYIEVILKMLGITYISELSSGICRDVGYSSIAKQIELFGKVTILALSMPILLALLQTIEVFLSS